MKSTFTFLRARSRWTCAAALASGLALQSAAAEDSVKPKPAAPSAAERAPQSEIARYCGALAPSASEARAAYQIRRLADLEQEAREEIEKLEAKESAAREWVTKREAMMKAATDDVVAIYGKMPAEAAAAQLAAMDENVAVAVLAKLNPRAAGAILSEMQADKAAKLSALLAGAPNAEKT
jgi:flagellar motility protein MotE (MotC chaperone)